MSRLKFVFTIYFKSYKNNGIISWKVFINICSHEAVPVSPDGFPTFKVVGHERKIIDKEGVECSLFDVTVNPIALNRAKNDLDGQIRVKV
jgi:hypothetical protein